MQNICHLFQFVDHFVLKKEKNAVFLVDKSSNGTFVNGRKIGKNNKITLSHNDEIGLAQAKKNFIYMANHKEYLDIYPPQLREKYTVCKELGKGACGTVVLGINKTSHEQVAIKIIEKKTVSMVHTTGGSANDIMKEVRILQKINHPCIIRLEDVIETQTQLFIILEFAEGGELFNKIIEKTKFKEDEAKLHFYQVVSGVKYLHENNIAHRDLKPEKYVRSVLIKQFKFNCGSCSILLCNDDDSNPIVKITDMGLSKFVDVGTQMKTFCGTPQYLAPEVLFGHVRKTAYDNKVDMWSLGVILYILLTGCPPFNPDRKDKPLVKQASSSLAFKS